MKVPCLCGTLLCALLGPSDPLSASLPLAPSSAPAKIQFSCGHAPLARYADTRRGPPSNPRPAPVAAGKSTQRRRPSLCPRESLSHRRPSPSLLATQLRSLKRSSLESRSYAAASRSFTTASRSRRLQPLRLPIPAAPHSFVPPTLVCFPWGASI